MERNYHEKGCTCGYLNPVTKWAGGQYVVIIAYECPQCKKITPASEVERRNASRPKLLEARKVTPMTENSIQCQYCGYWTDEKKANCWNCGRKLEGKEVVH